MEQLYPLDNRVLIKPDTREDTYKGIIHLPNMGKERPTSGVVTAIGDNCEEVAIGDHVLFGKFAGVELEVNNIQYSMVRESDILAIIVEVEEKSQT